MSKNMYSLILTDEIVRAVDKLAYQKGTNRSNLINQILAEHLSLKVPEKRVSEVFACVCKELDGERLRVLQQSGTTLAVKGAVNFKYNPTIRYNVEIESTPKAYIGTLTVSARTQNQALLNRLKIFYDLWMYIEQSCLTSARKSKPKYEVKDARFSREISVTHRGEGIDSEALGGSIAGYLHLFDSAMNMVFETESGRDIGIYKEVQKLYEHYLENNEPVL